MDAEIGFLNQQKLLVEVPVDVTLSSQQTLRAAIKLGQNSETKDISYQMQKLYEESH